MNIVKYNKELSWKKGIKLKLLLKYRDIAISDDVISTRSSQILHILLTVVGN